MILNSPYISGSLTVTGNEVITGSLTVLGGITGAITGSATSASFATNASLLNGTGSGGFTSVNSFNSYTSSNDATVTSVAASTALALASIASLTSRTGSYTLTSSFNSYTASNNTTMSCVSLTATAALVGVGALAARTGSYATTGSNTFDGGQYFSSSFNPTGFTTTASLYTDGGLRVTKDAYISGTLYLNNVTVFGTQSVAYISSSQLNIGTNIITVNTDIPSVRFGGLSVYDSGSTGLTGSLLWDSQNNHWVYSNPSGSSYSGGMFISGPRTSTLGSETGTTSCALMMGQGGDHITSSAIFHYGNATCFYGNSFISSSGIACFAGTICTPSVVTNTVSTVGTALTPTAACLGYGIFGYSGVGLGIVSSANGPNQGIGFFVCGDVERMRIITSGNVGIGTVCPSYLLDVNGTGRFSGELSVTSGLLSISGGGGTPPTGGVGFRTVTGRLIVYGGTSDITFQKNSNAGPNLTILESGAATFSSTITGTTLYGSTAVCSPVGKFTSCVDAGNITTSDFINVSAASSAYYGLKVAGASGAARAIFLAGQSGYSNGFTIDYTGTAMKYSFIDGNVGIGATAPSSLLHICGTGTGAMLRIQNTSTVSSDQGPMIQFMSANQVGGQNFESGYIQSIWTSEGNGFAMRFATKAVDGSQIERMRITSAGSVVVGNATYAGTTTDLSITGDKVNSDGYYSRLMFQNSNQSGGSSASIRGERKTSNYATELTFYTNVGSGTGDGSERMRITCGGNVGIGKSVPDANSLLDVNGQAFVARLALYNDNGTPSLGTSPMMYSPASATFALSTGTVERMRITNCGNVLIGMTSSVSGRVSCIGLQAQNEVYSRGSSSGFFWEDRSNTSNWGGWYTTAGLTYLYNGSGNASSINMSTGAYTALSDVNKKKDFEDSTIGLNEILQLKPTLYRFKDAEADSQKELGFIAQEVKDYIPQAYVESDGGMGGKFIGLNDRPIIATLVKGMQEQQCTICSQASMINTLKTCLGIA
jgi:hypothetical protein